MDPRILDILESLLRNIEVLNEELLRLGKSEQFTPTSQGTELLAYIRSTCKCSLKNICTIERNLYRRKPSPSPAEVIPHDRTT